MRRGVSLLVPCLAAVAVLTACPASPAPSSQSGLEPQATQAASPTPSPTASKRPSHHQTGGSVHTTGSVPAVDMPNRKLTPGVALPVTAAQVCTTGYAGRVRNVPASEKEAVYARYAVEHVPYQHEVDHLISLEIGGSNDIRNLWPEPYAGRWGARTKDVLENKLHDLVCSHRLSLRSAQQQEASNWVAAYKRYVGGTGGGGGGGGGSGGTSAGGYYASSYPNASTIYCADDPAWRSLSSKYLVHFTTLAQANARFPSYHLHKPC
jgi:hypothetical protein